MQIKVCYSLITLLFIIFHFNKCLASSSTDEDRPLLSRSVGPGNIAASLIPEDDLQHVEAIERKVSESGSQSELAILEPRGNANTSTQASMKIIHPAKALKVERDDEKGDWCFHRSGLVRPNPQYVPDIGEFTDAWEVNYLVEQVQPIIERQLSKNPDQTPLLLMHGLDFIQDLEGGAKSGPERIREAKDNLRKKLAGFGGTVLTVIDTSGLFFNSVMKQRNKGAIIGSSILGFANTVGSTQTDAILAVVSMGQTLNLPVGGYSSRLILGTTIALSVVPETHEATNFVLSLLNWNEKDPLKRRRLEHTVGHKLTKLAMMLGSGVRASVKGAFLYAVESDHIKDGELLFYFIIGPSLLSEILGTYHPRSVDLDRVFYKSYTDKDSLLKKEIINNGIDSFLRRIDDKGAHATKFRARMYGLLREQIFKRYNYEWMFSGLEQKKEEAIALTGLFMVYGKARTEAECWGMDVGNLPNSSVRSGFFDYLNKTSLGIAAYTTYEGIAYAMEEFILGRWLTQSVGNSYISRAVAFVYAAGNCLLDFAQPKAQTYSSFNPARIPDHRILRYTARIASAGNALLHLWWIEYMAKQGLIKKQTDYISLSVLLASLGVHEGQAYDRRFNSQYQDLITAYYLSKMNRDNPSHDDIKNLFHYLGTKLSEAVDSFDPDVVQAIYDVGFRSHVDNMDDEQDE